jgi:hypothetical protein
LHSQRPFRDFVRTAGPISSQPTPFSISAPTPVLSSCPDICPRHTCLDPLPVLVRCILARVPTPITRFLPRRLFSALTKAYLTAPTVLRPRADPCSELVQTAVLATSASTRCRFPFARFLPLCRHRLPSSRSQAPALRRSHSSPSGSWILSSGSAMSSLTSSGLLPFFDTPSTPVYPLLLSCLPSRYPAIPAVSPCYGDRLFTPPDREIRLQRTQSSHSPGHAGHPSGRTYWRPRMSQYVAEFVRACDLCFGTKTSRSSRQGSLQPLPVPFRTWSDASADYITPLPKCERHGQTYKHIVVVCLLTKMRHFITTATLTAKELTIVFLSKV